jgi:hypothetical protein
MPLEVLYQRSSHYIVFHDATGFQGESRGIQDITDFYFIIQQGPSDLKLLKKKNVLVLQRKMTAVSYQLMSAQQSNEYTNQQDTIDQALALQPYSLICIVQDKRGNYLPQRITLNLDSQVKHNVSLFRTVKSSRLGASGGVFAQLRYSNQLPGAWALVTVSISMPNGLPALVFKVQADNNGEFLLALDRLPMPNLTNNTQYSCTLTIQSDYSIAENKASFSSDHNTFNPVQLALDSNDFAQLNGQFDFDFSWGDKMRLANQNATALYLHQSE